VADEKAELIGGAYGVKIVVLRKCRENITELTYWSLRIFSAGFCKETHKMS